MKTIIVTVLSGLAICYSAVAEDFESLYQQMAVTEKQIVDLRNEYSREKQRNDQRLLRIEDARSKGDSESAERELKAGYASAERLSNLNMRVNEKGQELENYCNDWRRLYGPTVDALLGNAEKEKNAKKRAEIGTRLQKYQSLNSRSCVQAANPLSAEWKNLRVESYDGPQEIDQKVQLLKDISREMSIQLTRMDEQYKQVARERSTRERAREFIEEGTLFEGGVNVRTRGTEAVTTAADPTPGNGPTTTDFTPEKSDIGDTATDVLDASPSTDWQSSSNPKQTETDYKKQRSELVQQQEEIRNKIKEFEEKIRKLIQP